MDAIYHEKQVGQLCAQHCLNNLLQGSYFDPVQLADIATKLDDAEKARLTEGNSSDSEKRKVLQKPSTNMDDSGFFSIQVISNALRVFEMEITTWSAPRMKHAQDNPVGQTAFICNHDLHWIAIRKLGRQWFNLDSLKSSPELISDTYLRLFLTQLQMEGYSIFVVTGIFPSCEADELLTLIPIEHPLSKGTSSHTPSIKPSSSQHHDEEDDSEDLSLAMAISASMADQQNESSTSSQLSEEELRLRRLLHFDKSI